MEIFWKGEEIEMDCVKMRNIEVVLLSCVGVVNHIILNLPNAIFSSCGSASVLNMVFVVLLGLALGFLVSKVFQKFPGSDVLDIAYFLGGKWLKLVVGVLFIVFFIFASSLIVRTFSENLKIQYFATTPLWLIVLSFLVVVGIANFLGAKSIIRCNSILIPIMIASLLIAVISVIPDFVWQRFFPVLGNGATHTFLLGCSNIFALSSFCFLFLLPPFLQDENGVMKVTIHSVLLSGALLILSVMCLLLALPFITTTNELSPMFLIIRTAEWGNVFQRPESLFVLIWCLSILCYLSVIVMLILHVFRKISAVEAKKIPIVVILLAIFVLALLPRNFAQMHFAHYQIYRYFMIGFIIVFLSAIFLLAYFKRKWRPNLPVRKE